MYGLGKFNSGQEKRVSRLQIHVKHCSDPRESCVKFLREGATENVSHYDLKIGSRGGGRFSWGGRGLETPQNSAKPPKMWLFLEKS